MIDKFYKFCSAILETLDNALPALLIVIFYQMTILEIPVHEIMGMLGWVLFVAVGLIVII